MKKHNSTLNKNTYWYSNYWYKISNSLIFKLWNLLFFVAVFGLIFSLINTFTLTLETERGNNHWKEYLFFFFYFTNISSFFAIITSALVITNVFSIDSVHAKKVKNLMVTSLTITIIFYWIILFPQNVPTKSKLASGLIVHGITPFLALFVFIYESFTNNFKTKNSYLKTIGYNYIFPLLYLTMGIIFYYSLGNTKHDAIYSFLDFNNGNIVKIIIILISIAISFPCFSAFYIFLNNYSFTKFNN